MPHVIIEHSANVAERVDIDDLVVAVHGAMLDSGLAAIDALRTRAASREHYAIGDRHDENAFVAVTIRLGPGRNDGDLARLVDAVMDAVEHSLGEAAETSMLSVEVTEIDPARRVNRNHLRPRINARTAGDPTPDA